jgi:HlyD family secretion protein
MDEVDAGVLAPGLPARVTVDSLPGRELAGTVTRVAPYVEDVEEQNRTVEIEARIDDAEVAKRILPGTSADVEVILQVREDVVRIPTAALLEGTHVLVVEDGVLAERAVETGLSNWNWTEVTEGLVPGDEVVTSLDRAGVEAGAEVVVE